MTYLDTHIAVWLYEGKVKRLSQSAAREIDRAGSLLVSPMVELELEYLNRTGKLNLKPSVILEDLRARIGLAICDIPFPLVTREALSIGWTTDVFDLLIVAQASATRSHLVSADSKIIENYTLTVW